jgi:hypothetical protein
MGKRADSSPICQLTDLPFKKEVMQRGEMNISVNVVRAVNVYVRENLTKTLRRRENV